MFFKPLKSSFFGGLVSLGSPFAKSRETRDLGVFAELVVTRLCGHFWSRSLAQNVVQGLLSKRILISRKCGKRELTLLCKLKCYEKPMKDPLGVSPSKGNQGTTRGKEKFLLGIEPTTSGLDLPLLCRLGYEVGQRKSGTIKVVNRGEEKVNVHMY